jgi:hypothetical protein
VEGHLETFREAANQQVPDAARIEGKVLTAINTKAYDMQDLGSQPQ